MKKITVLALIWGLILVLSVAAYAAQGKRPEMTASEKKAFIAQRAEFASFLETQGFKKQDIAFVQKKGYSPYVCFLFLRIADTSGKPVMKIVKYREHGYSLGEICTRAGLDYAKFIVDTNAYVAEKNIVFPEGSGDEMNMDSSTMPRTEVQE